MCVHWNKHSETNATTLINNLTESIQSRRESNRAKQRQNRIMQNQAEGSRAIVERSKVKLSEIEPQQSDVYSEIEWSKHTVNTSRSIRE